MENVEFSVWLEDGVDVSEVKSGLEKLASDNDHTVIFEVQKSVHMQYLQGFGPKEMYGQLFSKVPKGYESKIKQIILWKS